MLENSARLCALGNGFKRKYTDLDPLEVDLLRCSSFDPATSNQVETFQSILWGINVLQYVLPSILLSTFPNLMFHLFLQWW